jgi:hypothetical protein
MEKLPFTQFDFTLYNTDEMEETVSKSHFKRMKISEKEEEVKSKTGNETITRNYTILTIKNKIMSTLVNDLKEKWEA